MPTDSETLKNCIDQYNGVVNAKTPEERAARCNALRGFATLAESKGIPTAAFHAVAQFLDESEFLRERWASGWHDGGIVHFPYSGPCPMPVMADPRPAMLEAMDKLKGAIKRADAGLANGNWRTRPLDPACNEPCATDALLTAAARRIWPDWNPEEPNWRLIFNHLRLHGYPDLERMDLAAIRDALNADWPAQHGSISTAVTSVQHSESGKQTPKGGEAGGDMGKEEAALGWLVKHPDWTNSQIAAQVGCNVAGMSRMKRFTRARAALKGGRQDAPKGTKDEGGNIEAYE